MSQRIVMICCVALLAGCGDDDTRSEPDAAVGDAGGGGGTDAGPGGSDAGPGGADSGPGGFTSDTFVYLGNQELTPVAVNTASGAWEQHFGGPRLNGTIQNVAIDPVAHLLFTSNYMFDESTITVGRFDPATGDVTGVGTDMVVTAGVLFVALAPDSAHLFALTADARILIFAIDGATGALSMVGQAPTSMGPRWIVSRGNLIFVTSLAGRAVGAYRYDAAVPSLTRVDQDASTSGDQDFALAASAEPLATAVHPSASFLLVANVASGADSVIVLRFDAAGVITSVGNTVLAAGATPTNVELETSGRFVYVAENNGTAPGIARFSFDSTSGAMTPLGLTVADSPDLMVADPRGFLWANSRFQELQLYRVDATSGDLTPVLAMPVDYYTAGREFGVYIRTP